MFKNRDNFCLQALNMCSQYGRAKRKTNFTMQRKSEGVALLAGQLNVTTPFILVS